MLDNLPCHKLPRDGGLGRLGAAADASHVVEAGIETILYGPGGGISDREYRLKGHLKQGPPDERISLKDIITTQKFLHLLQPSCVFKNQLSI